MAALKYAGVHIDYPMPDDLHIEADTYRQHFPDGIIYQFTFFNQLKKVEYRLCTKGHVAKKVETVRECTNVGIMLTSHAMLFSTFVVNQSYDRGKCVCCGRKICCSPICGFTTNPPVICLGVDGCGFDWQFERSEWDLFDISPMMDTSFFVDKKMSQRDQLMYRAVAVIMTNTKNNGDHNAQGHYICIRPYANKMYVCDNDRLECFTSHRDLYNRVAGFRRSVIVYNRVG